MNNKRVQCCFIFPSDMLPILFLTFLFTVSTTFGKTEPYGISTPEDAAIVHPERKLEKRRDQIYGLPEGPCASEGGICIKADECPQHAKAPYGLCEEQQSRGFECCFGLPKSERRCYKLGGECFPKNACNKSLQRNEAEGCDADQTCCILV